MGVMSKKFIIYMQWNLLRIAKRIRYKGEYIPLFFPRADLHFYKVVPSWVYRDIFLDEVYAPPVELRPRPRVVDLGANVGLASLYFLSTYKDAELVAVEANTNVFDRLCATMGSVRLPHGNFSLINKAVSDKNDIVRFYLDESSQSALNASITGRDLDGKDYIVTEVECFDVRELLDEYIDVLKVDIEGSEYGILRLPEICKANVNVIAVEFHDLAMNRENLGRVLENLIDNGKYTLFDRKNTPIEKKSLLEETDSVVVKFA